MMNKLKQMIFFLSAFCCACHGGNDKLENALRLAGDNRPELEKVLDHYSENPADSLQLRAARFLIENMPGHYTLTSPAVERMRERIYADTSIGYLSRRTIDIVLEQLFRLDYQTERKEDIHSITADYLISHIDASFRMCDDYSWLEIVPFDTFLEYLLPYRTEHERLEPWRDSLRVSPEDLRRVAATDAVKYSLNLSEVVRFPEGQGMLRNDEISRLFGIGPVRDKCADNARREVFLLRSVGIPSALDYVPLYANRNGEHHWCSIVGNDELQMEYYRKAPKIYRQTYSRNPVPEPADREYIPELFLDPFLKDVTDLYLPVADPVVVPSPGRTPASPHAYLCVFNSGEWKPAAIAAVRSGRARFSDMALNVLYLPVSYKGHRQQQLGWPFVLDAEGRMRPLVPDTLRRRFVRIYRKYPATLTVSRMSEICGTVSLRLANDTTAENALHIPRADSTHNYYAEWKISDSTRYRYCLLGCDHLFMATSFAELRFFDGDGRPLRGSVAPRFAAGMDGDPLTNAIFPYQKSLVIDFGRPVSVSRVVLLPRGDGNGVYPGDEYELFYHDLDGWQSLGRRTATDYFLDYDNLPAGALYWLHNHTRGVEERPFTITPSGDIRFW